MPRTFFLLLTMLILAVFPAAAHACSGAAAVCAGRLPQAMPLIANGHPAEIIADGAVDAGISRAIRGLRQDLRRVSGSTGTAGEGTGIADAQVLIGTLGTSPVIDRLVREGKLDVSAIEGKWEGYVHAAVPNAVPGVANTLVIAGSDKRGTIFGIYDLSQRLGVSPWHWWADVPVRVQRDLSVMPGARSDMPTVKYRGIFINDEEPALGGWARARFGGINAAFYEKVGELILRQRGNYLWPAMWGKSYFEDDPKTAALLDEMGVVVGTSHHEPLMRAHTDWNKERDGAWDYTTNAERLREFWREGMERTQGHEKLVTIGMRGDGDEPMSEGTAIELLERIVADQRQIIADVTGRTAERTPQVWALYKEVQEYYDRGMKVPDDVTLLFADDNWGQIRRLPATDAARAGGYGVYYHFDYVGGPRSYKWLNTNQIEKTWQQMDLAYRRGARSMWIVNVGDIKPMEFPIDFFMKMAWDPEAMTPEALAAFPGQWASATFGEALGSEIGGLVSDYSRLAARRKPELVDASSYALGGVTDGTLDGGEFGAMVAEWDSLERRMEATRAQLSPDQRDAYFQLVEHPVAALANLYRLYYAVAWNRRLASANDARANAFADQAKAAFARDAALSDAYHKLNRGKWDGMMRQTKLGYTSWNDPKQDVMPEVRRVEGTALPVRFQAAPQEPDAPYAAIEAIAFTRQAPAKGLVWQAIPGLGRTAGAVGTFPQGQPPSTTADGIRLDYELTLPRAGDATLRLYMVPTLDIRGSEGMRIGVSVDDGPIHTLTMNLKVDTRDWEQAVRDNAFPLEAGLGELAAGRHTVKLWRIDDNMLVQKLVLYTGELPPSYLGPAPSPQ